MIKSKKEEAARIAHQANKYYCESIGDFSQVDWEDAPEWQKESARKGVEEVIAGKTPERLHEAWCEHKASEGWVYGDVKDPDKKTHPCLVPYSNLSREQKAKDIIFFIVAKSAMRESYE